MVDRPLKGAYNNERPVGNFLCEDRNVYAVVAEKLLSIQFQASTFG
jgi:hypothetical protein